MKNNESAYKLITKRELALECRCSVRCLDNWMREGLIPYLKVGRSVRFQLDAVIESLRQHEVPAKPQN